MSALMKPHPGHAPPIRGELRRLLRWYAPVYTAIYIVWAGTGILLTLQVEFLDPARKVANLALVTTIGAVASMLAQPVAGLISDRTRSRFGNRAPWMVGGAGAGALIMVVLSLQTTVPGITLGWVGVCIAYHFVQAPLMAILPDRVPSLTRGRFSAVSGLGVLVGLLTGQFLAAKLSGNFFTAYLTLGLACFVIFTAFAIANPDGANTGVPRDPIRARTLLSAFWVNPIRHPDFAWAFTSRTLLNLAYYIAAGSYLLYVLADYAELGTAKATATIPLLTLAGAPGAVLATALAGPLSDRLGRRKIFLVVSGFIFASAMAVPVFFPTLPGMMVAYIVGAFGFGVFQSVDAVLISEVLPNKDTFAKDLGIVNMAFTLPQTLAPAIAGAIVLSLGYVWLFPAAIVLSALGGLTVIPIRGVR